MKYLSTILLMLFTSCLLAQNPTYEQTVDFIKTNVVGRMLYEGALDSYQRATGHKLTKIEIQKDGRIKLVADQQHGRHDFEIVFNVFDLKSSIDYPDGIRAYKFLVHFQGLNVSNGYGITFATDADAKRVARAFRHLKTMCTKGGGLFDEPTQIEKKPTLTKAETMKYIEDLLNDLPELYYEQTDDTYFTKDNIYQRFNASTGAFTKLSVSSQSKRYSRQGDYSYNESEVEYIEIYNSIKKIALLAPFTGKEGFVVRNDAFDRKYFRVKIDYELKPDYKSPIKYFSKWRRSDYDIDDANTVWHTKSQAKYSCQSNSWESSSGHIKELKIYFNNEADAKRFKRAFEHLLTLINEEKNMERDDDPFGN